MYKIVSERRPQCGARDIQFHLDHRAHALLWNPLGDDKKKTMFSGLDSYKYNVTSIDDDNVLSLSPDNPVNSQTRNGATIYGT